VKVPALLYFAHPQEVYVLGYEAFFYPLWTDIDRLLLANGSLRWRKFLEAAYVFHLWNGFTENRINAIDELFVMSSNSMYAFIAREALGGKK
jgi:hypothetical protein